MFKTVKNSLVFLLSALLVTPLIFSTKHWHAALFIYLIMFFVFVYNYLNTQKARAAFVLTTFCGSYLSLGLWGITKIKLIAALQSGFAFPITFYTLFIFVAFVILKLKHSYKKSLFSILSAFSTLIAFALITALSSNNSPSFLLAFTLGFLLGYSTGSIAGLVFEVYFRVFFAFFGALLDYIRVLLKPFIIFFFGYITISVLYAGVYYLIYSSNPSALSIPGEQIAFTDLLIYSLDTMTTGGNSAVKSVSQLAQLVNVLNVFTAIIWMTIMLAATIAYAAEFFPEISKKHRESEGKKGSCKPQEQNLLI